MVTRIVHAVHNYHIVPEAWHGGPSYWSQFPKADAAGWSDPSFFPIGIWLSPPGGDYPAKLQAAGCNYYMPPETGDFPNIAAQGMFDIHGLLADDQDDVGEDDPLVVGWFTLDEPDMKAGTEPQQLNTLLGHVATAHAKADGRFTATNIGNGIGRTFWCPNTVDEMVQAHDFTSVDQYAYTASQVRSNCLLSQAWPDGVTAAQAQCSATYGWLADQMKTMYLTGQIKPFGVFVETAIPFVFPPENQITMAQLEGAVWAAITHGASAIQFFQHNNASGGYFYSLADDPGINAGVAAVMAKVTALAAVINTPTQVFNFTANGIDTMLKIPGDGYAYIFAGVALAASLGSKTFWLPGTGISGSSAEVLNESRSLPVTGVPPRFTDSFAAEYSHHIYKIAL